MNDPPLVSRPQSLGGLGGDVERLFELQRSIADLVLEGLALYGAQQIRRGADTSAANTQPRSEDGQFLTGGTRLHPGTAAGLDGLADVLGGPERRHLPLVLEGTLGAVPKKTRRKTRRG